MLHFNGSCAESENVIKTVFQLVFMCCACFACKAAQKTFDAPQNVLVLIYIELSFVLPSNYAKQPVIYYIRNLIEGLILIILMEKHPYVILNVKLFRIYYYQMNLI